MKYAHTMDKNIDPTSTAFLLQNNWASCQGWARFLRDSIKIQGIAASVIGYQPKPNRHFPLGADNLAKRSVTVPKTLPAQANPSPLYAAFKNHFLVEHADRLTDPSYGTNPFQGPDRLTRLRLWVISTPVKVYYEYKNPTKTPPLEPQWYHGGGAVSRLESPSPGGEEP